MLDRGVIPTCFMLALLLPLSTELLAQTEAGKSSEKQRLRLFITDYGVAEGSPIDAATANDILAKRIEGDVKSAFSIITKENVAKMMDYEALKQMLGTEDDGSSLMKLGETIQADRLIQGSIGKVGETYVARLTLYDLANGVVEKRIAGTFRGAQDLAITRLNEQADQMRAYLLVTYAPDTLNKGRRVAVSFGKKKPDKAKVEKDHGPSWLDVSGAALVGLGVGLAAGGGAAHATMSSSEIPTPIVLYAAGGVAAAAGAVLIFIPVGE